MFTKQWQRIQKVQLVLDLGAVHMRARQVPNKVLLSSSAQAPDKRMNRTYLWDVHHDRMLTRHDSSGAFRCLPRRRQLAEATVCTDHANEHTWNAD